MTTPLRMPPRTSARGAAGLGPPAFGPRRPSLPPAPAPRTPALPAVAARPPLPATGLTSAQACGTSFCTHGIMFEPPALPSRPPSTRAPHLAVHSVPLFACPTCTLLLVYCCSSSSSVPLRTVDSSQAAAGHVLDHLFLVLAPLPTFLRFGLRLSVPVGCSFFLPCVICPPLVGLLGHQRAALPWSAHLGPAQRRGSLSGSVHPRPGSSSPSDG